MSQDTPHPDFSTVAAETPEESVQKEFEATASLPDVDALDAVPDPEPEPVSDADEEPVSGG
jgi:hypothetical protein